MAAVTYWVRADGSGNNSNSGADYANALADTAGVMAKILARGDGDDYTVKFVNDGTHTYQDEASGNAFTSRPNNTYVFEGCDSSGNAAFATIQPAGGDTASVEPMFRLSTCSSLLVQYLNIDGTVWADDPSALVLFNCNPQTSATDTAVVRYCQFKGDALPRSGSGTHIVPVQGDAFDLRIHHCYFEGCDGDIFDTIFAQNGLARADNNVFIDTGAISSSAQLRDLPGDPSTGRIPVFDHNTWFVEQDNPSTTAWPFIVQLDYFSGTSVDGVEFKNNLLFMDNVNASYAGTYTFFWGFLRGDSSYGGLFDGTEDIGYNMFWVGSGAADNGAASVQNYAFRPFSAPYTGDNRRDNLDPATGFGDLTSTYVWSPTGSAISITIAKDLRPRLDTTADSAGGVPGALPAWEESTPDAPDNGTGDATLTPACVDGIYDMRVTSDNATRKIVLLIAENNLWYDLGTRVLESAYYEYKTPAKYTFTPFSNNVYIASTNSGQGLTKFNGIARTTKPVAGAPSIGFAVEHFSRLVGAGVPEQGSFVYSSATEDFDDWEPGALASSPITLGITIDDGQRITGLSSAHYGRLYVFKDRSISVITGSWSDATDVARRTLSTTRGSLNHAVIQQVGNDILFWDDQGCHSVLTTDKFGDVETVSNTVKIREEFKSLVDFSTLQDAHSINYLPEDLYITWFKSRGSDTLDLAFVYNYSKKEWAIWDYEARCSALVSPIEDPRYKMWTGKCNGVDSWPGPQSYASAEMASGGLLMGDPIALKNYEEVELYVVPSGDFDVTAEIEFNADDLQSFSDQITSASLRPNSGNVLGEFTLDEDTLSANDEIKVVKLDDFEGGSGRSAIVKIRSSVAGNNLEVLGYVVRATRRSNS